MYQHSIIRDYYNKISSALDKIVPELFQMPPEAATCDNAELFCNDYAMPTLSRLQTVISSSSMAVTEACHWFIDFFTTHAMYISHPEVIDNTDIVRYQIQYNPLPVIENVIKLRESIILQRKHDLSTVRSQVSTLLAESVTIISKWKQLTRSFLDEYVEPYAI